MAYQKGTKYYPDYVKQGGTLTSDELKEFTKIVLPVTCNRCGHDFDVEGSQILFCPNCGAKLPPYGAVIIDPKEVHEPTHETNQNPLPTFVRPSTEEPSPPNLRKQIRRKAGFNMETIQTIKFSIQGIPIEATGENLTEVLPTIRNDVTGKTEFQNVQASIIFLQRWNQVQKLAKDGKIGLFEYDAAQTELEKYEQNNFAPVIQC